MKDTNANKLEKIVVSSGIGKIANMPNFEDKILPELIKDFSLITGQKPARQPSKISISGFKLRKGMIVGLKSTLRGKRMIEFLEKLIKIVLPRIRDFRGVSEKSIDESGNLSLGIRENVVFPEINPEISKANFGVEITIVPQTPKNRESAIALYQTLGIPFRKR